MNSSMNSPQPHSRTSRSVLHCIIMVFSSLLFACSTSPIVSQQTPAPTQTSCPAAGKARAFVSRRLVLGHHQNLVFSTGINLQRYDTTTGKVSTVVQFNTGAISEAQISSNGAWILFVNQVDGQSAIQMVRMDGQDLQTLHCAPLGQTIFHLSWSPDQQLVAFDEGTDFFTNDRVASTGAANTYLLQINTGRLQTILIQPLLAVDSTNPTPALVSGYWPLYWIDNTRLFMREYIRCCGVEDPLAARLYLLDISQGPHQQVNNLRMFTQLDGGSFEGLTLGPDRSKLFLSHCSCGFSAGTGPSSITEQPPTGERTRTIYTNTTSAITSIVILNQSALLVLVESYDNADAIVNVDTSRNGLWRINADGSGWTRLTVDNSNQQTTLNTVTQYPWANISRDGTTYAAQTTTIVSESIATYSTLYLGSVQGGTTKNIYSGPITSPTDNLQSTLSVVGWTTM